MTERTERKSNAQQLASMSQSGVTKSTAVTVTETLINLIFTRCTHDSLHTVVDNGLSKLSHLFIIIIIVVVVVVVIIIILFK